MVLVDALCEEQNRHKRMTVEVDGGNHIAESVMLLS
jgi:hypothetical protein